MSNTLTDVPAGNMPVGTILPFAGTDIKEPGWLMCNGDPVNAADYAELADTLGPSWGDLGPSFVRRLDPQALKASLYRLGLTARLEPGPRGMVRLVAATSR